MRYTGAPERTVIAYEDGSGNPVDVSSTTALPVTGGGGGGGGSLSDTVFVDSTGQLFVYRDTGSGTPSAFAIPSWSSYTPVGAVTVPDSATNEEISFNILRMLQYLNAPQGYDKSLQRQRGTVVIESGTVTTVSTVTTVTTVTTVSTVTTCGTVTTLSNLDGYNARMPVFDNNKVAWAQCVRARIT